MPELRLATLADDLLDAVVDAATTLGIDLPARRIIADGAVAWDCELVAVALPTITRGTVGADVSTQRHRASDTYVAEYRLWVLRGVPMPAEDGSPPAAAKVTEAGKRLMDDGYLLTVGLRGHLATIGHSCQSLAAGPCTAQGPEGGLAGWSATIRVGV